jgi:hypothetical protein
MQVLLGSIWDLLTAQCDRHSENIFIDSDGNLQFIDNDKALGVVSSKKAVKKISCHSFVAFHSPRMSH